LDFTRNEERAKVRIGIVEEQSRVVVKTSELCSICLVLAGMHYGEGMTMAEEIADPVAAKPLFRDPVHDGAADPVVRWNRQESKWFMFYTNRRANLEDAQGVDWVHGTRIGIAESTDAGASWTYRGTANIDHGEADYSYWAPEVVEHQGLYHMYLTVVPGTFTDWSGTRDIVHLTSTNLLDWAYRSTLKLASDRVIDACVFPLSDGTWRMWYNNERDGKSIYAADSPDLYTWTDRGKVVGDRPGEGPVVFHWRDHYWMVVDSWQGLGVYRADDAEHWERQPGNLLEQPGAGTDDQVKGGHPDVVVSGDRAFLFYFTHPGRRGPDADANGYEQRRSSIQVVELGLKDGWLACDRDPPTRIRLAP
jgi:beta-xylosidase